MTRHQRHHRRKREFIDAEIERRGGTCEWPECTRDIELTWHHIDPAQKLFMISDYHRYSYAALTAEMAKCEVLCPGHHHMAEAYLALGEPRPEET